MAQNAQKFLPCLLLLVFEQLPTHAIEVAVSADGLSTDMAFGNQTVGRALTPAQIAEVVLAHNKKRCMHGVPNVAWNAELANLALTFIRDKTKMEHDPTTYNPPLPAGENLAGGSTISPSTSVQMWYDEVDNCRPSPTNFVKGCKGNTAGASGTTGHFTAMIGRPPSPLVALSTMPGTSTFAGTTRDQGKSLPTCRVPMKQTFCPKSKVKLTVEIQARTHPHQARAHPHQARAHPHQARAHPHQARAHPPMVRREDGAYKTSREQAEAQWFFPGVKGVQCAAPSWPGFECDKAMTQSSGEASWHTENGNGVNNGGKVEMTFDFQKVYTLSGWKEQCSSTWGNSCCLKDFKIQKSQSENGPWEDVLSGRADQALDKYVAGSTFSWTPTAARYWKLVMKSNHGNTDAGGIITLMNMEFQGAEVAEGGSTMLYTHDKNFGTVSTTGGAAGETMCDQGIQTKKPRQNFGTVSTTGGASRKANAVRSGDPNQITTATWISSVTLGAGQALEFTYKYVVGYGCANTPNGPTFRILIGSTEVTSKTQGPLTDYPCDKCGGSGCPTCYSPKQSITLTSDQAVSGPLIVEFTNNGRNMHMRVETIEQTA
eukprot:CAMPEP_0197703506 /NCGR_PEP_ID=MMETSP1338-20131121/125470_1 /TAXON_ID=43686 ORGANISM="Pelagodinium beii, Strain RCC1491" /NCGR_SAMPLE_ID=MMETSP1338 /ASSEMBLY_ACC=CAM_ASM_000754 /LENGTH=599 /DNA_ID=CAMNT_0043287403 /DNA_START=80 /DNA_END=1877 /DNA_ORIENTATION=+